MKSVRSFYLQLKTLHPLVRTLLLGTLVVNTAQSMCAPFFAVYLAKHANMSIATIGLVIGIGTLAGTVGGFLGGAISDVLGRRKVILLALMTQVMVYIGYTYCRNPFVLVAFILIGGFFGSFFGPTSKAILADVTPQELRVTIFSKQYVCANIGYAVGPLIGISLGMAGSSSAFFVMAMIYLAYVLILSALLRSFPIPDMQVNQPSDRAFVNTIQVLRKDRALLMFLLGGLLTTVVHGQWSAPISLYLIHTFSNGEVILSSLLTTNALVVVFFQPILSKWCKNLSILQNIWVGSIFLAVGSILFAFSTHVVLFILGMVVFTIGEVLIIPAEYGIIDSIAPPHLRGAYYGTTSFTGLGNGVGPWLFSTILTEAGGTFMFLAMAVCAVLAMVVYRMGTQSPAPVSVL